MPKLVLLPGMDGTGELFADVARSLPDDISARVISYPPDRFLNYAQLTEFVAYHLIFSEPYVLLAESFSTPLAIQLAATNPQNLKGVVICCGFATSPIHGWKRGVARAIAPSLMRLPLPDFVVREMLVGRDASDGAVAKIRDTIRSVEPSVLPRRVQAVFGCDYRKDLEKLKLPMLYLRATQDRLVPESSLTEMLSLQPEIAVARIPGPHLLLQSNPELAARVVSNFVKEVL